MGGFRGRIGTVSVKRSSENIVSHDTTCVGVFRILGTSLFRFYESHIISPTDPLATVARGSAATTDVRLRAIGI